MKKEGAYLSQNKKNSPLDEYDGQWVAFANGKVVAHQGTLEKLMKKVERLKGKPSVFLVPKKNEKLHI
jgi:hypothetical protein